MKVASPFGGRPARRLGTVLGKWDGGPAPQRTMEAFP